jgi:hypothetical protein
MPVLVVKGIFSDPKDNSVANYFSNPQSPLPHSKYLPVKDNSQLLVKDMWNYHAS